MLELLEQQLDRCLSPAFCKDDQQMGRRKASTKKIRVERWVLARPAIRA